MCELNNKQTTSTCVEAQERVENQTEIPVVELKRQHAGAEVCKNIEEELIEKLGILDRFDNYVDSIRPHRLILLCVYLFIAYVISTYTLVPVEAVNLRRDGVPDEIMDNIRDLAVVRHANFDRRQYEVPFEGNYQVPAFLQPFLGGLLPMTTFVGAIALSELFGFSGFFFTCCMIFWPPLFMVLYPIILLTSSYRNMGPIIRDHFQFGPTYYYRYFLKDDLIEFVKFFTNYQIFVNYLFIYSVNNEWLVPLHRNARAYRDFYLIVKSSVAQLANFAYNTYYPPLYEKYLNLKDQVNNMYNRFHSAYVLIPRIRSKMLFIKDSLQSVRISIASKQLLTSSPVIVQQVFSWIEYVGSFVYTLSSNIGFAGKMLALNNLINLLGVDVDYIKSYLTNTITSLFEYRPISLADDAMSIISQIVDGEYAKEHPLFSEVMGFLTTIISLPVLLQLKDVSNLKSVLKTLKDFTKFSSKDLPLLGVLAMTFVKTLRFGYRLVTGTLAPPEPAQVQQWCNNAITLMQSCEDFSQLIEDSEQPSVAVMKLHAAICSHKREGEIMLNSEVFSTEVSPALRAHIQSLIIRLEVVSKRVNKFVNCTSMRPQPACVVFIGEPGCGKTNFCEIATQQHARMFGINCDHINRYEINGKDPFFSGFLNNMIYATLDDPQMVDATISGIDEQLQNLGHIINTKKHLPRMPEAEDKGQFSINFVLVTITANVPGFGIRKYLTDPQAFARRTSYMVELILRDEWKDPVTGNPKSGTNDHLNEAYIIRRWRPVKNVSDGEPANSKWYGYARIMSPRDTIDWTVSEWVQDLRSYYDHHVSHEDDYVKQLNVKHTLCSHGVLKFACDLDHSSEELNELYEVADLFTEKLDPDLVVIEKEDDTARGIIKSYSDNIYDAAIPYAKPVIAASLAVATAAAGVNAYRRTTTTFAEPISQWDNPQLTPNAFMRSSTRDSILSRVDKCTATIDVVHKDGRKEGSQGLYIGNSFFLIPLHLIYDAISVKVNCDRDRSTWPAEMKPIFYDVGDDLALLWYPRCLPKSDGLLSYLYDGQLQAHASGFIRTGYGLEPLKNDNVYDVNKHPRRITYSLPNREFIIHNSLETNSIIGKKGNCGSALILDIGGKAIGVCGIVIATSSMSTYFEIPNVGRIRKAMQDHPDLIPALPISGSDYTEYSWKSFKPVSREINKRRCTGMYIEDGCAKFVRNLGDRFVHSGGATNSCRKTEIADDLPFLNADQFEPPIVKTKKVDGVYDNEHSAQNRSAFHNMSQKPTFEDLDLCKRIVDEMEEELFDCFTRNKCDIRPLTLHEAINGTENLEALNFTTSFGFPFMGPKTEQMEVIEPYVPGDKKLYKLKPEVEADFNKMMELSKQGEVIDFPYLDTAKQEVVKPSKNASGDIRFFCGASCFTTLRDRILFGSIVGAFKKHGIELESAWGYSTEDDFWTKMCNILSKHGFLRGAIAGDFKKFDKFVPPEVALMLFNMLVRLNLRMNSAFYVFEKCFNVAISEGAFPSVAMRGDVLKLFGINPSGKFTTTFFNILFNKFLHRYGFYKMFPELDYKDWVEFFFFGDDSVGTSGLPGYNQATLAKKFAELGITYTDANKSAVTTELTPLNELIFLGRGFWKFENYWLAPLRGSAFVKGLCWLSPATKTSEADRMVSLWPPIAMEIAKLLITNADLDSDQADVIENLDDILDVLRENYPIEFVDPREDPVGLFKSRSPLYCDDVVVTTIDEDLLMDLVTPCSGPPTTSSEEVTDSNPVVDYSDMSAPITTIPPKDLVFTPKLDPLIEPSRIFERPVIIAQNVWASGTNHNVSYELMKLYVLNNVVKRVLAYYKLMRATMLVKIVSNGNMFTCGRLAIGYIPVPAFAQAQSFTSTNDQSAIADRITQLPGPSMGLNAGMSETVEFEIPYMAPQTWIELRRMESGSSSTFQRNDLHIHSYAPLRTSNSLPSEVTYTIFVSLKDVQLAGPTTNATPISGPDSRTIELQEHGMVSSVSSKVALAASTLADVPIVGQYAGLTRDVANTVTNVAKFFGYSMPESTAPKTEVTIAGVDSLALTSGISNSGLLSLDPEYGISQDPAITNTGKEDQLAFGTIAGRWSLLTTATVQTGTAPGTEILNFPVHPMNWHVPTIEATTLGYPNAITFCAYPFRNWTGPIEYCICPIGSPSQRFRFAISYNPNSNIHTGTLTNEQYTVVVDMEPGKHTTVVVPWMAATAYLNVQHLNPSGDVGVDTTEPYNPTFHNGTLAVTVINPLVSPSETAEIDILVFVRAGKGFELAAPMNEVLQYVTPISGPSSDEIDAIEMGPGFDQHSYELNPQAYYGERIVSFRPMVKRFNYQCSVTTTDSTFNYAVRGITCAHFPLPFANPAAYTAKLAISTPPVLSNNRLACNTTFIAYISPAFQGRKGSMRYKVICHSRLGETGHIRAFRGVSPNDGVTFQDIPYSYVVERNTFGGITKTNNGPMLSFNSGAIATSKSGDKLEFTVPFYHINKYAPTNYGTTKNTMVNDHFAIEAIGAINWDWDQYVAGGEDIDFVLFLCAPLFMAGTRNI